MGRSVSFIVVVLYAMFLDCLISGGVISVSLVFLALIVGIPLYVLYKFVAWIFKG